MARGIYSFIKTSARKAFYRHCNNILLLRLALASSPRFQMCRRHSQILHYMKLLLIVLKYYSPQLQIASKLCQRIGQCIKVHALFTIFDLKIWSPYKTFYFTRCIRYIYIHVATVNGQFLIDSWQYINSLALAHHDRPSKVNLILIFMGLFCISICQGRKNEPVAQLTTFEWIHAPSQHKVLRYYIRAISISAPGSTSEARKAHFHEVQHPTQPTTNVSTPGTLTISHN